MRFFKFFAELKIVEFNRKISKKKWFDNKNFIVVSKTENTRPYYPEKKNMES